MKDVNNYELMIESNQVKLDLMYWLANEKVNIVLKVFNGINGLRGESE